MKKKRTEAAADLCRQAIDRVDLAISNHHQGLPEDLNLSVLNQVRKDLLQMSKALDKDLFRASYGRYLLDWPDEHGLIEFLLSVSQNYNKWT